jgi:PKD repeat protein
MLQRPLLALAVASALAAPAAATADDYSASSPATLTTALNAAGAHVGADRVILAAGTYTGHFVYSGDALEVLGAGRAQTTIAASGGTGFFSGSVVNLHDLGFSVSTADLRPVELDGTGTMTHVDVHLGASATYGIVLNGASFSLSDIAAVSDGTSGILVAMLNGNGVFDNIRTTGGSQGINIADPGTTATVTHAVVRHPANVGIASQFGAATTVRDSLVDMRNNGGSGIALLVDDNGGSNASHTGSLAADRVTVVGDSDFQRGVAVYASGPADHYSVTLRDAIVTGFGTPLSCQESTVSDVATLATFTSAVPGSPNIATCGGLTQTGRIAATPLFVDAANGNFHLAGGSLLDAGSAGPVGTATDLDGLSRLVDGDCDGTARVDPGAYETQHPAPVVAAAADPVAALTGQALTFSGSGAATYAWSFDDGATADGASVSHAFTTAGTHTATLTGRDGAGCAATAGVTVTIAQAPPAAGAADRKAPRISKAKLRKGVLSFTLSEAAKIRIGSTRVHAAKTRTVRGHAGVNKVKLKLAPGRYRVTLRATDAAGNKSSIKRVAVSVRR